MTATRKPRKPAAAPRLFAVKMQSPHAGLARRWVNIDNPYDLADFPNLCANLADDAKRLASDGTFRTPLVLSEFGKPGVFVSLEETHETTQVGRLCLSRTVEQWRADLRRMLENTSGLYAKG